MACYKIQYKIILENYTTVQICWLIMIIVTCVLISACTHRQNLREVHLQCKLITMCIWKSCNYFNSFIQIFIYLFTDVKLVYSQTSNRHKIKWPVLVISGYVRNRIHFCNNGANLPRFVTNKNGHHPPPFWVSQIIL